MARLNPSQIKEFTDRGVLCLPRFLSKAVVESAREFVFSKLKGRDLDLSHLPVFRQTTKLSQMVKSSSEIDRLMSSDLLQVMDELAGRRLRAVIGSPQLLLSMPHREEWSLRQLNWHLDLEVPSRDVISGIQAFTLIDDVAPRGGATLAIAGSHRLHYLKHGKNAHGVLMQSREFTENPEAFQSQQLLHGIPIQIVEMSGRAGDVFVMDLRVLHSPSINATRKLRMMATNRFV